MLKRPISHEQYREQVSYLYDNFAEHLQPNTTIKVAYEDDYHFHIYAKGYWDSKEATIKDTFNRVKQLKSREQ